jgi:DNA-binding transcriptional LysR family regulator
MMNLNQLMVVLAVAEHDSVSRAATVLRLSQPAVSRTVKEVESYFGIRLFERRPHGVRLTEAGRALVAHARAVRDETLRAEQLLAAFHRVPEGRLVVGLSQVSSDAIFSRAVAHLLMAHPEARIEVLRRPGPELLQRLATDQVDLVFVSAPHAPANIGRSLEGIEATPLYIDTMAVVARVRHPLARRRRVGVGDLSAWKWVLWTGGTPARLEADEVFRMHQVVVPEPSVETDSVALMFATVAASDLLTIVPRGLAHDAIAARRVAVVPVEWTPTPRLGAALSRRERGRAPLARAMLDSVRHACRELGIRLVPATRPNGEG